MLAAGVWLVLRQIDGVLVSLQTAASGGYGANGFGAINPSGLQERVTDLLAVWQDTRPVSHAAFGVYTMIDLLFIAVYVWLLLGLFDALRAQMPEPPAARGVTPRRRAFDRAHLLVLALAAVDVIENALRAWMVAFDDASRGLVVAAWLASSLKLLGVASVLLLLGLAWREVGLARGPGRLTPDTRWALARLRVPVILLAAWGMFIIFDPTGQSADMLRRWYDSPGGFGGSAAVTLLAALALGFVTWTSARRTVLAECSLHDATPSSLRWLLVLVALIGGVALGWRNLLGFAVTITAIFGLGLFAKGWDLGNATGRETQEDLAAGHREELAAAPTAGRLSEIRRVMRALATWPLVALLLALASASTAPAVVLLAQHRDTARAIPAAVVVVLTILAAAAAAYIGPALLRRHEGDSAVGHVPSGMEKRHVVGVLVCAVIGLGAILWPFDIPGYLGAIATTAIVLAVAIAALSEGQLYGDTRRPPRGLTVLGFRRVPVALLLILAFVIASLTNEGSYHDVHHNNAVAPSRAGLPLTEVFADWKERNCATAGGPRRDVPLVFVGAPGGGIRASYWTSSVLTELLSDSANDPDCSSATGLSRVLAMGGASGGSVGINAYLGHVADSGNWYRRTMGRDFAAVPTAWGLLVDLPRNLFGFESPDRARRFEEAWEREDPTFRTDFFAGQSSEGPVLMLAGTQVESGCRLNISPVRLTARSTSSRQGECRALLEREAVMRDPTSQMGSRPLRPVASLTSDVLDYLCSGGSLNRSTAALMSARFPYVSPSGNLRRCVGGRATSVVDGGYAENTGSQQLLSLWDQLEPLVAEHNANPRLPRIVPIFVEVDNHYSKTAKIGGIARTQEMVVPLVTRGRADKGDDRGVEQLANARFSTPLPGQPEETCEIGHGGTQRYVFIAPGKSPGIPAPLAWTLSRMAMDDLDHQRVAALASPPARRLRDVLAGAGAVPCTPR